MNLKRKMAGILILVFVLVSGCGYTNKVILPYSGAKTIAIPMFKNTIRPENTYTYVAGLESHITKAVIDDLVKDGNLKLADEKHADLILQGEIIGYEQEPFRFNRFEQVDEFRLFIVVKLKLLNAKTGAILWAEENFSGDTQYFVNGPRAIEQEQAAQKAMLDLAEKIVNRVVEEW